MDQQFQTSFIPRKPSTVASAPVSIPRTNVSPQMPPERKVSTGGSILGFITGIFFIGSIASAIGVYAYNITLTKNITSMSGQIKSAKDDFQPALVEDLEQTDKRLKSANEVFNNHIIVSPIFKTLQDLTLKTISFNNFSYDFNKDGNVIVKLTGLAINYDVIALQSDALSTNRFIKDPVFSNLNLDEEAKIKFDLEFVVDKSFVNYIDDVSREINIGTTITPDQDATTVPPLDDGSSASEQDISTQN